MVKTLRWVGSRRVECVGLAALVAVLGVVTYHASRPKVSPVYSEQRLQTFAQRHGLEVTKFPGSTYLHPPGVARAELNLLKEHPDHLDDWWGVVKVTDFVTAEALDLSAPQFRHDFPRNWRRLGTTHAVFGDPCLVEYLFQDFASWLVE